MTAAESFQVIGVSRRTAGLALRERLAWPPRRLDAVLDVARAAGEPVVPLSTCHRVELYSWGPSRLAAQFEPVGASASRLAGADAVRHLMAVAAGLESHLVGETEILQQVRRAWDRSRAAGASCTELDLIFEAAITAGRRARRETWLGRHPGSVASAATVAGLRALASGAGRPNVLVLGAGEAATGAMRALEGVDVGTVTVVCRRPERALVGRSEPDRVLVGGWDRLEPELARAQLVIAATGADAPVLTLELIEAVVAGPPARPLVLVDLGVPRNVAPEVRRIPGVRVVDLDDVERQCPAGEAGSGTCEEAVAAAHGILEAERTRLEAALRARAMAPELAALHRDGARIAAEEAERVLLRLAHLSEADRALVRHMAHRLARRVLYPASRALRSGTAAAI